MDSVLIIKIVSAFAYPLGLVLIFTAASLFCLYKGYVLWSKVAVYIAGALLFLSSNPMVARNLAYGLESQYKQVTIETLSQHDAIIVLGGGLRIPLRPAKYFQLSNGSDRYWHAAQLFHAGKAKKILLSGGNLYPQDGVFGEAFYASQLLQQWGVPENAIGFEHLSRTTSQNYQRVSELVETEQIQSAILLTSAIHMPRAYAMFSKLPIALTPASADVIVREQNLPAIFNFIPSASALNLTTKALHEYYGIFYQYLKRW